MEGIGVGPEALEVTGGSILLSCRHPLFFFVHAAFVPVAAVIVTVVRARGAALLFMQEFYVTVARARRC